MGASLCAFLLALNGPVRLADAPDCRNLSADQSTAGKRAFPRTILACIRIAAAHSPMLLSEAMPAHNQFRLAKRVFALRPCLDLAGRRTVLTLPLAWLPGFRQRGQYCQRTNRASILASSQSQLLLSWLKRETPAPRQRFGVSLFVIASICSAQRSAGRLWPDTTRIAAHHVGRPGTYCGPPIDRMVNGPRTPALCAPASPLCPACAPVRGDDVR